MKRNRPGDTETAKQLLLQVVENDLEGKEDAENWLGEMVNIINQPLNGFLCQTGILKLR